MTDRTSIHAIVLAGGQSARMGVQKLGIRLGSKTVLERVVDAVGPPQIDSALVALGPSAEHLAPLIDGRVDVLSLDWQTPDMRTTLEMALRLLESGRTVESRDGVLVVLGDQPTLDRDCVIRLADSYREGCGRIVVPVFGGKRGHPAILPWKVIVQIRELPPDQGLNQLLRSPSAEVLEVPVDNSDVLFDLDVPADLDRLLKRNWD